MTIAATGIGKWPALGLIEKVCRHCQRWFWGGRSMWYCRDKRCQEERRRREREKARERGH